MDPTGEWELQIALNNRQPGQPPPPCYADFGWLVGGRLVNTPIIDKTIIEKTIMATAPGHATLDHLTIRYEDAGDGWIVARIEEEPAAISQGRTREEAHANVLGALRDLTRRPTASERVANALRAKVVDPLTHVLRR